MALLSLAHERLADTDLLAAIEDAARTWSAGAKSLAMIKLCFTRFMTLPPNDPEPHYRLWVNARLLTADVAPRDLLKAAGLLEGNPWPCLAKAVADDPVHPAWPAGAPRSQGGEYRNKPKDGSIEVASAEIPAKAETRPTHPNEADHDAIKARDPQYRETRDYAIDWGFVNLQESGQLTGEGRLDGYVPARRNPTTGKLEPIDSSGVTIAHGFDIGRQDEADIRRLGLDQSLIDKLAPYTKDKKRANILVYLQEHPLTITEEEARQINEAKRRSDTNKVAAAYDQDRTSQDMPVFDDLPGPIKTAIMSVATQYGPAFRLRSDIPTGRQFWRDIVKQDWNAATATLWGWDEKNFGPRRHREAVLLRHGAGLLGNYDP